MKKYAMFVVLALAAISTPIGWTHFHADSAGADMTRSAQALLVSLTGEQKAKMLLEFDNPQRVDWHFIPKDSRKGLQLKEMTEPQREAAHDLLRSALSQAGYTKTTNVMQLESLLAALQKGPGGGPIRDPERYYFTIFGEPKNDGRWGLSFEGHHLSLNFVVDNGKVISSTPQFLGSNPALIKSDNAGGLKKGTQVLKQEELLGFELVRSLSDEQRGLALIAENAPREIRKPGTAQPPTKPPAGLPAAKMTAEQIATLKALIEEYARTMPYDVAAERLEAIETAGMENVHFAWAGATTPGIGHYYRIQGPTFLVELVNTQPDAAGNPANHVHCVWRDMAGDFAIPIEPM
jgi:hypothetical protein